jgi:malonate transporter and related proteins
MKFEIIYILTFFYLIGYILKTYFIKSGIFWGNLNKINNLVFLPTLFFFAAYKQTLNINFTIVSLLIYFIAGLSVFVILYFNLKRTNFNTEKMTSLYICSFGLNYSYIAAISLILLNQEFTYIILNILIFIIIITILVEYYLAIRYNLSNVSLKQLLKRLFFKPIIVAFFIGKLLNYYNIPLAYHLNFSLYNCTIAFLPIALIYFGSLISSVKLKNINSEILLCSLLKLLIFPILVIFLGKIIFLEVNILLFLAIISAMPVGYEVSCNNMLNNKILALQLTFSILSLPLIIYLCNLTLS